MAEGARFTRGSTMGHVVRMTLAGALGLTFLFLIDVATLFWISRLRDEQLMAALGFVWVVQFFIVSSGIGISIATSTLVSRSIGQGKRAHARCQASAALVMAFAVQGLIAMTVLVLREPVLALAGADGATREIASRFLSVTLFSMPVMALAMVGGAVLRALGDAWRSMMVTMSAGAVAMVLDPVFIFWLDMGIDGAAWVMVIARLTAAGMALWFLIGVHDILARVTLADMRALFRPFAAIAAPATMTQLSTPFGNALLTGLVAGYGDGAVAGWAVVSRLSVLTFGGIYVLSGAIGGILGQNFGAGLLERVRRTYRDALVFCVIYTGVAWSLLYAARGLVVEVFSLGPDGARVVLAFAGIAAGGFVFTGILFVSNAAFNTLGRPFWSTSFNWLRDGIVLYPLALMLSLRFGAPGVIYGQALAGVVVGTVAGLAGWRFVKGLEPAGGGID
jgi:putative MATE family efflux protein